jgi:hypothetical protein
VCGAAIEREQSFPISLSVVAKRVIGHIGTAAAFRKITELEEERPCDA